MTKQEKIKEEYLKAGFTVDSLCGMDISDDGWLHLGWCFNGTDDAGDILKENFYVNIDFGDFRNSDPYNDGVGFWRPKALKGIENNNNWVKVEDELPPNNTFVDVFNDEGIFYNIYYSEDSFIGEHKFFVATHWRNINKDKPLY